MKAILLKSNITCPECGFSKEETMPEDACAIFYECENCKAVLKPRKFNRDTIGPVKRSKLVDLACVLGAGFS